MINLELPKDVRDYVLEYQKDVKIRKSISQYSQQSTILSIIREHKKMCDDLKNKKSPM